MVAAGDENTPGYIGPRLLLFGGATAIEDGPGGSIRLAGVTNDVHCYDVLSNKWTRHCPTGHS